MLRVIQILHHSLGSVNLRAEPESGGQGWHELVAREIAKSTSEFEIECWRPESSSVKTHVWTDSYRVTHRIYPSLRVRYGVELSRSMIADLRAELRENPRTALHLHGIYNLNTYLLAPLFGTRVPIVAHSHERSGVGYGIAHQARRALRKYALRNAARFFVSTDEERSYLSEICGLDKVIIAPLPVDLTQFQMIDRKRARTKLGWRTEDHYMLYVGRLEERKGVEYLLQARRLLASSFPRLHLVVVGSGSFSHKDMNDTILTGQVGYSDLPLYYNAADLCILPSLRESWARVVVESLACQVPVIGTWTGCVPTLVKDGIKGIFVVPMRDSVALADRISEVLPRSEELRFKIDRSRLKNYGSDNFVRQMVLTYRELAARVRTESQ